MKKLQQRLDKILSSQGTLSRADAHRIISCGAVSVNGAICRDKGFKADPIEDIIQINGVKFKYSEHVYIMMNKPEGVLSACSDKHAHTVLDIVPDEMKRKDLFPAGRLDKDTRGLLIITDDGDFAHRMLSPKKHIEKVYHAVIEGTVTEKEIEAFNSGVVFEDGFKCLPAGLRVISDEIPQCCEVTICEGKFHQVKKMFLAVGCRVEQLKRVKIGDLELDPELLPGECRLLDKKELNKIFNH